MNLILADAKVIDGVGGKEEKATLIIEGEFIKEVVSGGKVPELAGFTRLDCRGKTVMPGLFDTHVHVSGGDVVPGVDDFRVNRRMDEHLAMHAYRSLEAAQRALRAGFTTLRDMSARDFVDVQLRNAVCEGLVVAPRIICSGIGITMTGGHVWGKCIQVDGPDEVRKEVRRQVREGVDWIKVMGVTGGVSSPGQDIRKTQFTHEEICAAVEETHRLGPLLRSPCSRDGGDRLVRGGGHGYDRTRNLPRRGERGKDGRPRNVPGTHPPRVLFPPARRFGQEPAEAGGRAEAHGDCASRSPRNEWPWRRGKG